MSYKLASADSSGARFEDGSSLAFKDFLSFGADLALGKRSANGFEDGATLGIKLGIGSTLGVKLASTGSPEAAFKEGSLLGF
jgi:hypothetical protein